MRVLLDENLPHELRPLLAGHEAVTVAYLGWKGVSNGALLTKGAERGFEVLVTQDSGISYQHNPNTLPIAVVVLVAKDNTIRVLRPLVPSLLDALKMLQPRTVVFVRA